MENTNLEITPKPKAPKRDVSTVAINSAYMEKLSAICESLNMDKKEFLEKSIEYFSKTGDDPRAPIKDSLIKKLASIENRIIGFIKTQDNDYLKVLLEDTKSAQKRISTQKDEIIEANRVDNSRTRRSIELVCTNIETRHMQNLEMLADGLTMLRDETKLIKEDNNEIKRLRGKITEVVGFIETNTKKTTIGSGLTIQQAELIGTHLKALV